MRWEKQAGRSRSCRLILLVQSTMWTNCSIRACNKNSFGLCLFTFRYIGRMACCMRLFVASAAISNVSYDQTFLVRLATKPRSERR